MEAQPRAHGLPAQTEVPELVRPQDDQRSEEPVQRGGLGGCLTELLEEGDGGAGNGVGQLRHVAKRSASGLAQAAHQGPAKGRRQGGPPDGLGQMPEGGGPASSLDPGLELRLQIGKSDEDEDAHAVRQTRDTPPTIRHEDDGYPRHFPLDLPEEFEHLARALSSATDDQAVNVRVIRIESSRDVQQLSGAADCSVYSLRIPGRIRKDPDHCYVYFPGGVDKRP